MMYSELELAALIQQYVYPFTRIAGMFMVMPVLSSRLVTARVRLILALVISVLIAPMIPAFTPAPLFSLTAFLYLAYEFSIGLAVGFAFQVVFQVFVLSAQFIAMKMGLGFASMNDPSNGVQTTVLSQFFLMLTTLMFVAIDGHMILLTMLLESFSTLPPMGFVPNTDWFWDIANLGSWLFSAALVLSLPVLTSLLVVNIAFGVMSRAAPQLNIFAVGFPFTLLCGLFLIWIGLSGFAESFDQTMEYGFYFVERILK